LGLVVVFFTIKKNPVGSRFGLIIVHGGRSMLVVVFVQAKENRKLKTQAISNRSKRKKRKETTRINCRVYIRRIYTYKEK
ncbi:hypothetical protein, partial [Listeria monocytogenes]|uniref:hypothetical protein n=1 Tax=Listeria monocytogenes TaxID=1639 RepID=UPI003D33204D